MDQRFGPDDEFFKVRADDGNLYILRHQALEDVDTVSIFADQDAFLVPEYAAHNHSRRFFRRYG